MAALLSLPDCQSTAKNSDAGKLHVLTPHYNAIVEVTSSSLSVSRLFLGNQHDRNGILDLFRSLAGQPISAWPL